MSTSAPGDRRESREELRRLVRDIDQHPHPVAQVEFAGLMGNVARGIVQAEEGLEVVEAGLAHDLAVPLGIELVDHHAIVAAEGAHDAHDLAIQRRVGRCHADGGDPVGEQLRYLPCHLGRRAPRRVRRHRLELHRDALTRKPVDHCLQRPDPILILGTSHGRHDPRQLVAVPQPADQQPELGVEGIDRLAQRRRAPRPQDRLGIRGGLKDAQVLGMQDQQDPVRLDGAGELNEFPIAVGKVGRAEGRACMVTGHRLVCNAALTPSCQDT